MALRRYWQEMTTAEITARPAHMAVAVIPVAAVEQHGSHLPLSTDAVIAEGHVARVVELLPESVPGVFLPVQTIGWSEEHLSFPGTLTLSAGTLEASLTELAESVHRAGMNKIVFVNSHGGNSPVIDIVIQKLRVGHKLLAVATSWSRFGMPEGLFPDDERAYGIHGGALETSLMLHLRPDLVRTDEIADFPSAQERFAGQFKHLRAYGPARFGWMSDDLNPSGVVGSATIASAEKGAALLDHAARGFIELLKDVDAFDLGDLR